MADVGGMLYDKDAVYINLSETKFTPTPQEDDPEAAEQKELGLAMVRSMQSSRTTLDEKLDRSGMRMFGSAPMMRGAEEGAEADESDQEEEEAEEEVRFRNPHPP
jgi:ribosome biogenesis protein BMS1